MGSNLVSIGTMLLKQKSNLCWISLLNGYNKLVTKLKNFQIWILLILQKFLYLVKKYIKIIIRLNC